MNTTQEFAEKNESRIEKYRCDKQGIRKNISSRPPSEQYRKNYDRIDWSKK